MENIFLNSAEAIKMEEKFGANNYQPLPVVLCKGKGVFVWDLEDNKYFDFLSAYSAVNQGHCHPRLIKILHQQSNKLTLTSRAFHNNLLGEYSKKMSTIFDFDKVLPMNTGAEAVETAIKIARRWAYQVKNLPENEAQIIVCKNNFHGRTTTLISASTNEVARKNFGPYTPGFVSVEYNNLDELKNVVTKNKNIAAFIVEPIQGEAGVFVPDDDYILGAFELCKNNNVLFIADEIQTGIGRTGKLLALDYFDLKADILLLGKALSGGVLPVSAILANDNIMNVITPGSHGSTFGGNPLGCAVAMEALDVINDENLIENANHLGGIFRNEIIKLSKKLNLIKVVRGKGLLNAIVINGSLDDNMVAWKICIKMKENGLLAKPTHGNIIRFAPPLVITEDQLGQAIEIIAKSIEHFKSF